MIPFLKLRGGGAIIPESPGYEAADIIAEASIDVFANCRLFIFIIF
jgi:hypothetical protein